MMEITLPSRLYHYTSIDSLAMILSTKKLRLTRLDLVNDPDEASAYDIADAKKIVYATCWTAEKKESLPMWRIYTPDRRGVRISMPAQMLDVTSNIDTKSDDRFLQILKNPIYIKRSKKGTDFHTSYASGPYPMKYTDDNAIYCIDNVSGRKLYNLEQLGTRKKPHWEFENEWRIRVLASFSRLNCDKNGYDENNIDVEELLLLKRNSIRTKHIFVDISEKAFEDIEVMIGPSADESTEVILKSLISTYCKSAKIKKSSIKINW